MSVDLPLRLTERPFPEPIPSDTPHGGRPRCEVCRSIKKRDNKHNINVNNVKHRYIYNHVLKSITQNYTTTPLRHYRNHQSFKLFTSLSYLSLNSHTYCLISSTIYIHYL